MTIATPRAPWPYTERSVEVVPGVPKEAPREERFLWTDICSDCRVPQGKPHVTGCRMGVTSPSEDWHGGAQWDVERDHIESRPFCQDCGSELDTDAGEYFWHRRDDDGVRCWVTRFLRPRDGWFVSEVRVGKRDDMVDTIRTIRQLLTVSRRHLVRGLRWDTAEDVHAIVVFTSMKATWDA